ncbi:questin oxidase family protein [Dermatobacter hominis]|uniref:questin oxidase family protein n=1 Tax=Dermatobacter hominis TaxID=2884263 RepID=UPI001D117A86|nr:questin oxidase family protein [Dermatobacter hominis]UDY34315.1 questin oxidase family protein [Dermatobacter hominis]
MTTTTTSTTSAQTLDRLLDRELDRSPHARGGFISHLAMGLTAAARLGADPDELDALFVDWTSGDFLIGRDRPPELVPLSDEVARHGATAIVREWLPHLIGHPGAQFFHAVIRLDLALDADHPGQIANALLNWGADATPPAPGPDGDGDLDVAEVMARVAAGDRDALHDLRADDDLLDQVAAWVASVHDDPHDFGTLHFVTGTRAVRAVAPYLDDDDRRELGLRTVQALIGFTDRFGPSTPPPADELDRRRATSVPDWGELGRLAIASGDPHVVKLTYACRLEEAATGDPLLRWVAARQNRAA